MSERRRLLEKETEAKTALTELQSHFEAERNDLSQKLSAARDEYLFGSSNQIQLDARIKRIRETSQTLSAAIQQARQSTLKVTRRIEELKTKIELAQEEIENSTKHCTHSKFLTVALSARRDNDGSDKVMELLAVRNEYREAMYRIGNFSYTQKQNLENEAKLQEFCRSFTIKIQKKRLIANQKRIP
jgi:chromosome segregation ATPase